MPTEVVDPKLGDKKQGSFFTQYYIIVENGTKYITSEHLYDKARIGDFVIVKNDQTVDVE